MFFEVKIIISMILIGIMVSEILLKIDEDKIIKIILISDNIIIIMEIESNINSKDIILYFELIIINKNNNNSDIIIINISGSLNFTMNKQVNIVENISFIKSY